jgi:ABC-type multidrug transport system permease subunit
MLRAAAVIIRADLSYMLRQRETLLWVFVMPLLFFYFIGTVTGGSAGPSAERPDPIALRAPADAGPVVDELIRRLEEQRFAVTRPPTDAAFAQFARRLTVAAPAGYATVTAAVQAGQQIVVTFDRRADPLAQDLDRVRVSRAVYAVVADLAVLRTTGQEVTSDQFKAIAAMPRQLTLDVRTAGRRLEAPSGFSQAIPGTMVMFTMLVLLMSGGITIVVEREHGLLRRLASAPISRGAIVLGKWAARVALGLVQLAFAMTIGTVVFGVDWGANLPTVAVVLAAWAAFNASLALLLANVVRTQAQMAGVGIVSSMAMAALGGCWWPIEIAPPWMQTLALGLPTGWTMDAMHRLVNFADAPSAVVPHVLALGVGGLVTGWAASRIFRYQ